MKATFFFLFLSMAIFFSPGVLGDDAAKEETSLGFEEFVGNIDPQKNTSLHIEHFWTHNKGRSFTWEAKVVDVKGSRGKAEIRAACENAPLYKGFNLILVTYQKAAAAELKIGQGIKFKGNVYNYRNHGGTFILYVNNVQLLPIEVK